MQIVIAILVTMKETIFYRDCVRKDDIRLNLACLFRIEHKPTKCYASQQCGRYFEFTLNLNIRLAASCFRLELKILSFTQKKRLF